MMRTLASLLIGCSALGLAASAQAQTATLAPPDNQYFVGRGSWGQKYPDQWALQRIGFDASPNSAWRLVRRDAKPVIVAVIDTGLDWNHKNISWDNIWRNPKEIPDNGIDDDGNGFVDDVVGWDFFERGNKPWDHDGHGTFVSGIIAGRWDDKEGVAGINPFVRLMILKGINNFGHSRGSYLAEAITYAADNGARVINLSVGGKHISEVAQAAIDYAYSKGVVIVAAAGNEAADIRTYGVAASDKVITVASTGFDDERAVFSNWGKVSVAAPGIDVLSLRARRTDIMLGVIGVKYTAGEAYVGPDKRHYRASGTSFSAPLVAGVASLMIANDPNLTNKQVMAIIKSTARDAGTPGVDQYTGYGIVDAVAALKAPKDYFLFAGINRVEVVQQGKAPVVRVRGTADANALKSAHIEVGAGETPTSWKRVGAAKKSTGPDAVLGDIPAAALQGAKIWQIRVVIEHKDGATREARFKLNLG
ncbi:S8 family serine peptidase [Bradyrhizobium sp. LjRoot220]|uniref:S8 family serine peptidase n=1 Tax=Bradyrhizobium sp. LjRoot220 TaxID=3342284 RepID=UPI003ECC8EC3